MAINFVTTNQCTSVNGIQYQNPSFYPNGITKPIPCRSSVMSSYWRIPRTQGNTIISYDYLVATTAIKPRADALKVLRVKDPLDANTEYEMAILDTDDVTTNAYVDACNECCGDTPVMPTVVIPPPILESRPSIADNGTNTFVIPFPSNPLGLLYAIDFPWFNSVGPVTPYVPTGITTAALFVTWANTNWGDYGTWTSSGDVVTLVSIDGTDVIFVELLGIDPELVAAAWCFDFTAFATPAAVNGVKFGTADTIPLAPFMLTNTNQATVINRLTPKMPFTTFLASANKLQVTTLQAQVKLYDGTTLVATATAGAC